MKKAAVAIGAVLLLAGVGVALHVHKVNSFVDEVAAGFAASPIDAALVRTAGYPTGFLRAKIDLGEFKTIHDAPKWVRGYARKDTRGEPTGTVEEYVYRVGLFPSDTGILIKYDELGKIVSMPGDGANWK